MTERTRYDYLEIGEQLPPLLAEQAAERRIRPRRLTAVEVIGGRGTPADFYSPSGLTVDSRGSLYVADSLNHRVVKITAAGEVFIFGEKGAEIGQLLNPQAVVVDGLGFMYVVELGNSRVSKFSPRGEIIACFGYRGHQVAQFDRPCDLARNEINQLYVADTGNNRVQKFDATGRFLELIGDSPTSSLRCPQGMAVDRQHRLYVSDGLAHRIVVFSPSGEEIAALPRPAAGYEPLASPQGLAVMPDGVILVAECDANRIRGFTAEGDEVCSFGPAGGRSSQLRAPLAVAADPQGSVFVADSMHHRLVRLSYE